MTLTGFEDKHGGRKGIWWLEGRLKAQAVGQGERLGRQTVGELLATMR